MNLKSIKVFGFKTFAEPTALEFAAGITAVVGPNGSGKSNLVDAFRWVLGETSSRSLRGGKLEDVIFIGNDKRKPLGLAEVSILFDNSAGRLPVEYAEVEITRRAYRAGESEYFINRTPVRLRDVVELLMGTGLGTGSYAIVSQGQIDAILTSKPADRRALFEEAAGISRFLARKAESLRRLEHTERNAVRLSDVLAEIDRRIPELDTQVRRAKRYRNVGSRVRDLEILGYLRAGASRRTERETLRGALERNEQTRALAAGKAAAAAARLSETRTALYRQELQLEELRAAAQTQRADLARLEADYAAALARREALERQSTQTTEDAARTEEERIAKAAAIVDLDARLEPLAREIDAAHEAERVTQAAVAGERGQLDRIFSRLREVEAAAAAETARRTELRVVGESLRAEIERVERELALGRERAAELEIAAGALAQRSAGARQQLVALEERLLDARGAADAAARDVVVAQAELAQAVALHRERTAEVTGAQSRLHTIEELENALEGHVPGTRAVVDAWQRGELAGIEGIVSNLISTDRAHARALDVAFGARLSNVVTQSSSAAERAIEFLNRKEAGRATFLPLDTLGAREGRRMSDELARTPGVIGYAHELVTTAERYRNVVNFLVGNVVIVDRLSTGIALVRERGLRDTIVTLGGEQIVGGGAITGGRFARERSILSRRAAAGSLAEDLVGLRAALEAAEADLRARHAGSEGALERRESARAALARAEVELAERKAESVAGETDLARLQGELERAREGVAHLQATAAQARGRAGELEGVQPSGAHDEGERERLEAELAGARQRIAQSEAAAHDAAAGASALRERAAGLGAEREAAAARLAMLDRDGERAALAREETLANVASLMSETRTSHARIEGLRHGIAGTDTGLDNARRERDTLAETQTRLESDLRMAELEERDAVAGGERDRTRLAEIEAELGMLVSQFAQNPASDDECRDVEARYAEKPDEVVDELVRLREDLARLAANVNLNAEAERDELNERQTFLQTQLDDLSAARQTLLESIAEIEGETQARFNETFDTVAAAFSEMYAGLFPGGNAKMWQTDPGNLSETGIEISVQPPGKKAMPLPALSGGERAMTAAALIFALISVRPAPFYLLDEVDAALDDANVDRFSEMVRRFAAQSQMIVVTHNKKTMEMADRMYGVTMGEPGVSSIVSAELSPRSPELALA